MGRKSPAGVTLREAVRFHGHLGPYLVLGLRAGELALEKLKAKKYFDVEIKVWGANKKPKSCLIDGLQLSTGATYGKGNIRKLKGNGIKIRIVNLRDKRGIVLKLKPGLSRSLQGLKTHMACENFARRLNTRGLSGIFEIV